MQSLNWQLIGRRIVQERTRLGLTQRELAALAQIAPRTLIMAEKGHHRRMALPVLAGIAQGLETTIERLLYGS